MLSSSFLNKFFQKKKCGNFLPKKKQVNFQKQMCELSVRFIYINLKKKVSFFINIFFSRKSCFQNKKISKNKI